MTNDLRTDLEELRALAVFTHHFSILIDMGMSLIGCLQLLRSDGPGLFSAALIDVETEVSQGSTLSRAMRIHAEVFPSFYTYMIRVGEIGGILEVSLGCLSDWLEEMWTFAHWADRRGEQIALFTPFELEDWSNLNASHRKFTLCFFCRSMSDLIAAGVPLRRCLEAAAELLPSRQKNEVRRIAEDLPDAETAHGAPPRIGPEGSLTASLDALGFLPPLVVRPMRLAEELQGRFGPFKEQSGNALDKVAMMYRRELRYELIDTLSVEE